MSKLFKLLCVYISHRNIKNISAFQKYASGGGPTTNCHALHVLCVPSNTGLWKFRKLVLMVYIICETPLVLRKVVKRAGKQKIVHAQDP